MTCKFCNSVNLTKNGHYFQKGIVYQKYKCKDCGRESYIRETPVKNEQPKGQVKEPPKAAITEQQLRSKYDITYKIQKAANELSGDVFYTEFDFLKICELPSGSGFRHIVDSGLFDQYRGKAGGTIYWSCPENINRLKNEGVLR
jgi:hypothetical protein